jgi:malonate-semialdehyde dehydrogenase (acetylating)/methylmalonate-semialdehyde dehydrogenase
MKSISHWVNGSVMEVNPDKTGEIFNPATGQVSANVAFADAATVDKIVNISEKAFEQWYLVMLKVKLQEG